MTKVLNERGLEGEVVFHVSHSLIQSRLGVANSRTVGRVLVLPCLTAMAAIRPVLKSASGNSCIKAWLKAW